LQTVSPLRKLLRVRTLAAKIKQKMTQDGSMANGGKRDSSECQQPTEKKGGRILGEHGGGYVGVS